MKRLLNGIVILSLTGFMLGLNSCKTNSSLNCPDLASVKKMHTPLFAFNHHKTSQAKTSKPVATQAVGTDAVKPESQSSPILASSAQDMNFKIRMPNSLGGQLESDKELDDMNKVLASYSDNKVMLQRNEKGKLLLKAHSIKDVLALVKNTSNPRGYYERRYGSGGGGGDNDGAAVASAVLGPISFIFAFIPFLSFAAIPISIAAIITGAVGLRSHRQRMATVGLTFGILGLIFSILMSIFYFSFVSAFFI